MEFAFGNTHFLPNLTNILFFIVIQLLRKKTNEVVKKLSQFILKAVCYLNACLYWLFEIRYFDYYPLSPT